MEITTSWKMEGREEEKQEIARDSTSDASAEFRDRANRPAYRIVDRTNSAAAVVKCPQNSSTCGTLTLSSIWIRFFEIPAVHTSDTQRHCDEPERTNNAKCQN